MAKIEFHDSVAARTIWVRSALFPAYEVSSFGDVRRVDPANGATVGKVLTPKWHAYGYPRYDLYRDGRRYGIEAHRLVADAFLGPCPEDHEVAHLDGNPTNCHVSNLAYKTHKENESDKFRHGTNPAGERNGAVKLTTSDVRMIREMADEGITQSSIAVGFGISFQQVSRIVNRQRWAHI